MTIFDRYTILRLLGEGRMGDVHRAHEERLHRSVALKILRVDAAEREPRRARRPVRLGLTALPSRLAPIVE